MFENQFSSYTKNKFCVSCANGSDALYIAIKSLNLNHFHEIIIPDMTYIATASAVINNGCKLRIADVNLTNGNVDQKKIIKKINKNTKAIIIVSLWGYTPVIDELKKSVKEKKLH